MPEGIPFCFEGGPTYFPSAYFRAKARAALKGHWQTALLIALVVNLPSLLAEGIAAYTGNDPVTWLTGLVTAASRTEC